MMKTKQTDPVIEEIWEARRRIAERVDHDPAKLVAYYIELQKKYEHRLIDSPKVCEKLDQSAA